MATTTPNYGWPVPTSTDYVKDGATAIEALGDAIDATVFGLGNGMKLIKTQTIGTAVSSVTVTNAFSATYDAYKIVVSGGTTSAANEVIELQLGSSVTGYYWAWNYVIYGSSVGSNSGSNVTKWRVGVTSVDNNGVNIELVNPFLANRKYFRSQGSGSNESGMLSGITNFTTSVTSFILSVGSGTMTGGTIRVYGLQNS
jgi:hypothetical protein